MPRHNARTLLRWGVSTAFCAGVVQSAHAASLNGIETDTLVSYAYAATIEPADEDPPTIVANVSPAPNGFGWHNTAVAVSFTCDDAESGVASCTDPVTLSAEGAGQVVVGDASDNAGNNASISVSVNIDRTGPNVTMNGVLPGAVLPVLPPVTCTATDALSGVDGPCVVTFPSAGGAFFDAVGTARDRAGNVTERRVRFSLAAICGQAGVLDTVPCIVPPGYTLGIDLRWRANVTVYGTAIGKIRADNGSIVVESGGTVGGDLDQRGPGSIVLRSGASVVGKIKEAGDGDITIAAGATMTPRNRIEESGNGSVFVDGVVNQDVFEEDAGDLIVGPTGSIVGKATETGDGSVVVEGSVAGQVAEAGAGDVTVGSGGTLAGDLSEKGDGTVVVRGIVRGKVEERDAGNIVIEAGAVVDGTVDELDVGSITIYGRTNGRVQEAGIGDLTVTAPADVRAAVIESGVGSVFVQTSIGAGAEERDDGDLAVSASVTVNGSAVEGQNGNMTVGDAAQITGDANSGGSGTCTIAATATVGGRRLGACR